MKAICISDFNYKGEDVKKGQEIEMTKGAFERASRIGVVAIATEVNVKPPVNTPENDTPEATGEPEVPVAGENKMMTTETTPEARRRK